jgi:hypothetical protein
MANLVNLIAWTWVIFRGLFFFFFGCSKYHRPETRESQSQLYHTGRVIDGFLGLYTKFILNRGANSSES